MESLFDPAVSNKIAERIRSVTTESIRHWGKLDAPGMFAHCRLALETGSGKVTLKRSLVGRLLAWTVKGKMLDTDAPFGHNSPTDPHLIQAGAKDLEVERGLLLAAFEEFVALGREGMPQGPHPFFGPMTPEQWDRLMGKHIDHHLAGRPKKSFFHSAVHRSA